MSAAKPTERRLARGLRAQGVPYKHIASRLRVSPASAYQWTKDIELTPKQKRKNLEHLGGAELVAVRTQAWSEQNRERRRMAQQDGRRRARLGGDLLHQAGCMLYWAEGAKSRNNIKVTNSDVHMIRYFLRFLTETLDVPKERFALSINVYTNNGLDIEEIERHWLEGLDLPTSCVRKHAVNRPPTSSSGRKRNKLPYGVATLSLGDTALLQHIYGAIQEYAGFDEPRWLN